MFFVTPQPMDIAGEKSIVLIVAVDLQDARDPNDRCTLILERAVSGVHVRNTHYAARLHSGSTRADILLQLGLHMHCPPLTMRDCGIRLGMDSMDGLLPYDFQHGTFCLVWIGPRPESVNNAMNQISNAEAFFLQFERLMHFQPDRHAITFALHGISPANQPLGRRDVVVSASEVYALGWIEIVMQAWPFRDEGCTIAFAPEMTVDMQELGFDCFNFIVSFGHDQGAAVIIHQQIVVAESLQSQASNIDEFWALRVPSERVAHALPGITLPAPFWFRYARSQHIYPHLFVDGVRAREVERSWQNGDRILARFIVWQKHHALSILLREGAEETNQVPVEATSFLQKGATVTKRSPPTLPVFVETCQHIVGDAREIEDTDHMDVEETAIMTCAPHNSIDADEAIVRSADVKPMGMLCQLNVLLEALQQPDWIGINEDLCQVPDLHPHAAIAWQVTQQHRQQKGIFHIFTDGSCRKKEAAWAFVVLCECTVHDKSQFVRIGFAAGPVCEDIGDFDVTAQDAEATAMIAAAEFLMSQQNLEQHEVHLHFDACAVGFGSIGQHNVIKQDIEGSQRQRAARVMLSLVQQKFSGVRGCHVHAHQGHPWNEMADSLAGMVTRGWMPTTKAILRSGDFLKHPLRDWAWIQINPTAELPCLERILQNERPQDFEGKIDNTLIGQHRPETGEKWSSQLNFATVNVGTLEQDNPMPGTSVTFKTAELIRQFVDKKFHFVAIQESRARQTCQKAFGDFSCLVSQGKDGQAGVELWLNRKEISHIFKIDFQPNQDCCVWYSTSRILAVHCDLGSLQIQIVVVYGPQRGLSEQAIQQWWDELAQVLQKIPAGIPCFLMGDMNCRLGSVESDMIGHVGADFEDVAGERLRDLCNRYRLLAPATLPEYHQGPSWTHTGVK